MSILVTGGAGFIGSNFVLDWLADPSTQGETVVNLDALTYAGNLQPTWPALQGDARHVFRARRHHRPRAARPPACHAPAARVVHFAAESHVDRSIHGPGAFIKTNIEGTFTLLEAARATGARCLADAKAAFRFHHVSTDEVYGSLAPDAPAFTEDTPTNPTAPTAPARPPATTWCAPGTTPTACRWSPATAATTTGLTTFRRS
jgi:dTDP-glucose 4,6-dehydratase